MDDSKTVRIWRTTCDALDALAEHIGTETPAGAVPARNAIIDEAVAEWAAKRGYPWTGQGGVHLQRSGAREPAVAPVAVVNETMRVSGRPAKSTSFTRGPNAGVADTVAPVVAEARAAVRASKRAPKGGA